MQEKGRVYQIGNTTIELIAPQISEEEREERLAEIERVVWMIWSSLSEDARERIAKKYSLDKQV